MFAWGARQNKSDTLADAAKVICGGGCETSRTPGGRLGNVTYGNSPCEMMPEGIRSRSEEPRM